MFEVELYEDERGFSPVYNFIMGLANRKLQAKVVGSLEVLAEKGNSLREPYSKHLEDGIFELRCKVASDIVRLLYFFHGDKLICSSRRQVAKSGHSPDS